MLSSKINCTTLPLSVNHRGFKTCVQSFDPTGHILKSTTSDSYKAGMYLISWTCEHEYITHTFI